MVFGSVNTLLFIAWHFETASTPHKKERYILVLFLSMYALWFSRVSLTGEEEERRKRRRKKTTIFNFFKILFLGFYKAERKSEDMFVVGGLGLSVDIHFVGLSFHALSPLPIVLSSLHRDRCRDL